MSERLRVGIFAGGRSAEHEVSISSAESVLRAIDRERYEPFVIYIDRDGRWHLPAGPAPRLTDVSLAQLLAAEQRLPVLSEPTPLQPRAALRPLAEAIDVAFLVVHGPFGEDGTLQGFLELAGVPYIGAGVLASAVAMDKVVFKDLLRGHGLPVVDDVWYRRGQWRDEPQRILEEVGSRLGERTVVKPARLGSSLGMTLVHRSDELPAALDLAFEYDSKVIVEAYVANARELEVGVLGNDPFVVFEPGEVIPHREWYDYDAKYVEGLADVIPRADVEPELAAELRDLAARAYRAVDCAGMARVDFLAPPGAAYVSEMNTLPGFTTTSMFPKQAELAGCRFDQLITRLIELGLEADREGRTPARREAEA
ncbi:MAG TPA: D-alanine--D-alanine ligase family protein [Candidatus Limnocylindria bacterium]|nr:D-alanine--D-alanine ligase family protein [Candidatus Limnocylindria bacterium]